MTRSARSGSNSCPALTIPMADADRRLRDQLRVGRQLLKADVGQEEVLERRIDELTTWIEETRDILAKMFQGSGPSREFGATLAPISLLNGHEAASKRYRKVASTYLRRLESRILRLPLSADGSAYVHGWERRRRLRPGHRLALIVTTMTIFLSAMLSGIGYSVGTRLLEARCWLDMPAINVTIGRCEMEVDSIG